jgi:hypothetical protein
MQGDDLRLREKLSDDALAMAQRLGDSKTLALVLTQRYLAQWTPLAPPELESSLREAEELADRLGDPLLTGHAAYLGAHAAMDAGDLEEADRLLTRLTAVAEQLNQPTMRSMAMAIRTKRCTISGPAEEIERLAFAALELAYNAGQPDSMLALLDHLFTARFLQGSLDRGEPHLPDVFDTPGWSPPSGPEVTPSRFLPVGLGAGMSVALCEVGRVDDARPHFDLVMKSGLDELVHNFGQLAVAAIASVACARLGDIPSATRLYAMLEPHSHRFLTTGGCWFGATTHYLGLLAATLDRPDEADRRFAAAERSYIALDAKPWLARLHSDRAATTAH